MPALHEPPGGYFALDSLRSGAASLEGLLIGSGLVLWIALMAGAILKKEAMGFGDVKFVGAIGAFCGWHGAVFAVFGGRPWSARSPFCSPWSAARSLGKPAFGTQMPFGPMLAIAGAIYFLFLHARVDAWFAGFAELF